MQCNGVTHEVSAAVVLFVIVFSFGLDAVLWPIWTAWFSFLVFGGAAPLAQDGLIVELPDGSYRIDCAFHRIE